MIEPSQDARLPMKLEMCLTLGLVVSGVVSLDLFDRAQASFQTQIVSLVDTPHTTPADYLANFVSFA